MYLFQINKRFAEKDLATPFKSRRESSIGLPSKDVDVAKLIQENKALVLTRQKNTLEIANLKGELERLNTAAKESKKDVHCVFPCNLTVARLK